MRVDRAKFAAVLAVTDMKIFQLSEKSGVSRSTIAAVKSGKSCREDTIKKLADALNCKLEDIT